MAVHTQLAKAFRKYIPPNEAILATVYSQGILGSDDDWFCITEKRIAQLHRKGLFQWHYDSISVENVLNVSVVDSLLRSTIVLDFVHKRGATISNARKDDARDFASALSGIVSSEHDTLSQRTKVCPQCDEIVKYLAKVCKHCGFHFQ